MQEQYSISKIFQFQNSVAHSPPLEMLIVVLKTAAKMTASELVLAEC